jgi:membrane-associated phospholipid phosphatase
MKMCKSVTILPKTWRMALFCSLIFFATAKVPAQSPAVETQPLAQPSPTPRVQPATSQEHRFFANILRDQRAIWTSPFHLRRSDAKWLAPLGLSTAALLSTDRRSTGELVEHGNNQSRLRISRDISRGGEVYTTGGIAAAFYLIGRAGNNARARETGLLGAEALIDGGIVSTVLKLASQRPRPGHDGGRGDFLDGGNSFPSGHATSAWALATVVANEYKHQRLVQLGAYGAAAAVSISRYTGRNHFLSDVLIGSGLGYGIGRYVYRKNHDPALDSNDKRKKFGEARSKLIPLVSPRYNRARRTYGLGLSWDF